MSQAAVSMVALSQKPPRGTGRLTRGTVTGDERATLPSLAGWPEKVRPASRTMPAIVIALTCLMFSSASASVVPCNQHPGSPGTETLRRLAPPVTRRPDAARHLARQHRFADPDHFGNLPSCE